MDGRRGASLVMLAGGIGLVVGRLLTIDRFRGSLLSIWAGHFWVTLGLGLILVGLATRYLRRPGVGTLAAIGLWAVVEMLFTLNHYFTGDRVWPTGYSGGSVVESSLIIVSTFAVLAGVLWAAGEHVAERAAGAWWQTRWAVAVGGVAVLSITGMVGFYFWAEELDAVPLEIANEDDVGVVQDDWSITPDGDTAGSYIFSMVKTFGPMEGADVEEAGGRFVWPETELDLCDVNIWNAGDGFVQIGIVSPTTEGCPDMLDAFVEHGVPDTACLFVQANGTVDEHCAPLAGG